MDLKLESAIRFACRKIVWFIIAFILMDISTRGTRGAETEKALYHHLFRHYDPVPRPVSNSSFPVLVNFGIALNQILDLDEKKQTLTTSSWIKEGWHDDALQWQPSDFGGLDQLMVSSTYLWVPDIFIFNTAGGELDGFVNVTGSKLLIKSDGYVTWIIPLMIKSSCAVDVTYFPYDKQTCEIHFGSWIYDHSKLDIYISPEKPDLSEYIENNEFDILDLKLYRTVVNESCCPGSGSHPMITFKLSMDRKSMYYNYIVIAPTIMLCILTLVTFMLPCNHGEKIAIGLTVFLTLYVLQLLIAENVPDTNTTPILGVFIFLVMTLNCISLILATLVMSIKKRSTLNPIPNVPPMVLWFCKVYLSRLSCTSVETRLFQYDICSKEDDNSRHNENSTHNPNEKENGNDLLNAKYDYSCDVTNMDDAESDIENENENCSELDHMYDETSCKSDNTVHNSSSQTILLPPEQSQELENCSYRQILRNRRSYRRAIFRNNFQRKPRSSFAKYSPLYDEISVIRGKDELLRKREWCFIAEIVDKSSFIIYIFCTFVTILTVLVLVPSLQ